VKRVDILDLPDAFRTVVHECELTGRQTVFERQGRAVAILTSYDEYLALQETIAIANDARLRALMKLADAQAQRGEIGLFENLERLRIPNTMKIPDQARQALRKIDDDPIAGAPLFEPLRGVWSWRTEGLRIVYRIVAEARYIQILAIVYDSKLKIEN
jgi:PHD/YefM family antitoxin component YafN of YafNO toxin-antitoxin module/Txe/YoeB family toxin of Txe-Axe toxin-antitoxin module